MPDPQPNPVDDAVADAISDAGNLEESLDEMLKALGEADIMGRMDDVEALRERAKLIRSHLRGLREWIKQRQAAEQQARKA